MNMTYTFGTPEGSVGPDGYSLDYYYVNLPGRAEMQNDLILDYCSNVALAGAAFCLFPLPILQRSHGGKALEVFGEEGGIGEVEVFRDLSD